MSVINLNNGHTPRSPGGVFGGRTEYGESKKLMDLLSRSMRALEPSIEIMLTEGTDGIRKAEADSMLFVFHKGTHLKNQVRTGAEIIVGKNASAVTQHKAYRLLTALCGDRGFRYRGVHTLTATSPFSTFSEYAPENAYIIKAGFIDNEEDNLISDREIECFTRRLSEIIVKIYKEKKNEDNS